jgi:gliding motility-associated-like protein
MKFLYLAFVGIFSVGIIFSPGKSYAQVPSLPVNFYVIAGNQTNELHWDANPGGESVTNYKIYRSLNKSAFSALGTTSTQQYIDNDVDNGKVYFYKIAAVNLTGEGPSSVIDAGVPESKFGKFLRINGTEADTVLVNNSDELQLNVPVGSSFTIEFWMRVVELPLPGNEGYIIGRYTNTNLMRYVVRLRETGKLEFHATNLTSGIVSNTVIAVNKWYHIAVTYTRNGSTPINDGKIFINGILDKSSNNMQSLFSSVSGKMILGGDPVATNRFFNGYLDELRIWNGLRSQTELSNNKCSRFRGDEASLAGLWHFDEAVNGPTPMIYDYHKNGNNGGSNVKTMLFAPNAGDDIVRMNYNASTVIKVQQNDIGYSKTKLLTNLSNGYPLYGNATVINKDSVSYTTAPGFSGVDTLKYVLVDTASFCNSSPQYDTATVIIQVECGTKDNLDWATIKEGDKSDKQLYKNKGLHTTLSAKNKSGVSSSLKVGKKFKNKSSLEWNAVGAKKAASSDLSLSFNVEPDQFAFSLFDIDKESDDLIDSLVISGYRNGQVVELTAANIVVMGSAVSFVGNNSFKGTVKVNDVTSDDGNISINYFTPVDSVVLSLNNASPTAKVNSSQGIGLGNLTWCATVNNPPVILDNEGNAASVIRATTPFNEPLKLCVRTDDADTVFVTDIIPVQNLGILATAAPDTCLLYTPKHNFIGEESFHVTWCDDRIPAMCTEVEVIITVLPPEAMLPFLISEAVSPNGDNILDTWIIQGIERFPNNNVKVFNVWGDMVFEQHHYDNEMNPWRGEANSGPLTGNERIPDGTYYYIIDLGDSSLLLKGFVMLKR